MHSRTAIVDTLIRVPRGTVIVAAMAMISTITGTGTAGTTGGAGCGTGAE